MKLYVDEKLFSIHKKFYVKDENNIDVYEISSKVISLGDKTTINDMQGNKIAYIEQEILHLTPNYNVYINNQFSFKITRKLQLIGTDYIFSNGYRVEGSFVWMNLWMNFMIYDDKNNQIGSMNKKSVSIGNQYEIDIYNLDKKEIILAIIVAITNDINRIQNSSNN